jgi:glycosyltransferase involved in cell wall biosynthesis
MLVSVVIPTFNCADFLVEAIRSVLVQTYEDYEIIVVDDGSTDHTEAALEQFGNRVSYIGQAPGGPSVARNRGILEARGELIAFLDADDLWRPTKLSRQVEYLNHHPEAALVYTDFTRGPHPGSNNDSRLRAYKPRDPADPFHALLEENFIATPTVVVRREALARSGLFDPTLKGSEDFDLWLRLAKTESARRNDGVSDKDKSIGETTHHSLLTTHPFGFIDEILADVRQHESNTSRSVDFIRHQIRAARIMLERWGNDPLAAHHLHRRLGTCWWNLAYAEQCRGQYAEARTAYWSSARYGFAARSSTMKLFLSWRRQESTPPLAAAVTRAAFMLLPQNLIRMASKARK